MIISINGEVCSKDNAKLSVLDRGFLYGDSIYETLITFQGKLFRLSKHLQRLSHSANRLGLSINASNELLIEYLEKTLNASVEKNLKVRLVITRGEGPLSLDPTGDYKNNVVVIAEARGENPKWWYEKGVKIIIADILRTSPKSMDPNIKSGNYLNNVMAYRQAKQVGAFEAIMLNQQGQVTEATTSNAWIVKNGVLMTPPIHEGLLEGITRSTILELTKKAGLEVYERSFNATDIENADEMFLSSTTRFAVPVTQAGEKLIGDGKPGEITHKVLNLLNQEVQDFISKGK